jgi:hypothetical protein
LVEEQQSCLPPRVINPSGSPKQWNQFYNCGRRSDNILGDIPAHATLEKQTNQVGVINAKALLVTKAHFDSKVEAAIQKYTKSPIS